MTVNPMTCSIILISKPTNGSTSELIRFQHMSYLANEGMFFSSDSSCVFINILLIHTPLKAVECEEPLCLY